MTERNYALKKLMRNALLEVLGSGMSFSFVELREEIRRRYSDICIDDRKFSTLLYRIRKDMPEIKLENNQYYLDKTRIQKMEDIQQSSIVQTIVEPVHTESIQALSDERNMQENFERWDLTDFIGELNQLVDKAEKYCDRDLCDLALSSQQVISIRRMLDFTKKLKELLREEESGVKLNLAEINALMSISQNG